MKKQVFSLLKKIAGFGFTAISFIRLKKFCRTKKDRTFLIVDIDNTIADTGNHHKNFNYKENPRLFLQTVAKLENRIAFFRKKQELHSILFLSTRNIFYHQTTFHWLQDAGFDMDKNLLILTVSVEDKLLFLQYLSKRYKVEYYDDLSYNHENDEILYYTGVIARVKKMNLEYFDDSFLKALEGENTN